MNSRKYPRTLQEAFGPHTSRDIFEARPRMHRHDRIVLWGCTLVALAFVALVIFGVIK